MFDFVVISQAPGQYDVVDVQRDLIVGICTSMEAADDMVRKLREHQCSSLCGYFDCAQVALDPQGCHASLVNAA